MLTVSLLICAMMALAAADDPSTTEKKCPEHYRKFNDRCFLFVPRELTWAAAEKNCQSQKANLASVHSPEEDQFLQSYIREMTLDNPDTWIGGSDSQEPDTWFWSDGSVFSFTFWCSGKPDDICGNQGCLLMNTGANTCWDDRECSSTRPSMCAVNL